MKPGSTSRLKKVAIQKQPATVRKDHNANEYLNILKEPVATYTSRIRAIGNSKGVILHNQLLEKAGLDPGIDIVIQAAEGAIVIIQAKEQDVNTDLGSWDSRFKSAISKGAKAEKDLFEGLKNEFDEKEW